MGHSIISENIASISMATGLGTEQVRLVSLFLHMLNGPHHEYEIYIYGSCNAIMELLDAGLLIEISIMNYPHIFQNSV